MTKAFSQFPTASGVQPTDLLAISRDNGGGSYTSRAITGDQMRQSVDHTMAKNIGTNSHATIDTHLASTANPHTTTAGQVGAPALSTITAKGDLYGGTGAGTVSNRAVGNNNQVLVADSSQSTGLNWATVSGSAPTDTDGTLAANSDTRVATQKATKTYVDTQDALNILKSTATTKGDLLAATAAATVTRLGVGSDYQVLVANSGQSTGLTWATVSGSGASGKTYNRFVVAASGGDYTTLGAALAAMSNGDSVYVKNGTYTESAIACSLANITIVGESRQASNINAGANDITFTGLNVTIQNCLFTFTTGTMKFSSSTSNYGSVIGCNFAKNGANTVIWTTSAALFKFIGNTVIDSTTGVSTKVCRFNGAQTIISDNYFFIRAGDSGSAEGGLYFDNTNRSEFTGNTVEYSGNGTDTLIRGGSGYTMTGNRIYTVTNGIIAFTNTGAVFTGNHVTVRQAKGVDISANGGSVVSGNYIDCAGTSANSIGINVTTADNIITGNQILGPSTASSTGIKVATGDDVTIVGNYIKGFDTSINISDSATDRAYIASNKLYNYTTNAISNSGTTTHVGSDNYGITEAEVRELRKMKNTSGGTINAGNIVVRKAVAAGNEVTTTTTASDNNIIGVADESISNNAYGHILVRGKTTLLTVDGTTDIAIGDYISTFTTAGIGQKATIGTLGTTPGHLAIAYALEAYTANDSNGVLDAIILPAPVRL